MQGQCKVASSCGALQLTYLDSMELMSAPPSRRRFSSSSFPSCAAVTSVVLDMPTTAAQFELGKSTVRASSSCSIRQV